MLRIDNLKLPVGAKEDKLRAACAHALRVSEEALVSVHLLRRSIDAREGVKLVCSCAVEVKNESGVLRRCKNKNVQPYAPKKYTPPAPVSAPEVSPVVIGAGPAGLFCALLLARCGARPILLERGRAVEQRKRDVEHFWRTGELDLTSNVQFGEGGAGAFSDGKLNTGTKDLRHGYILEEFVRFGASEDILVDAKPHVGTDKLYVVLQNLRREIIDRGGEVRFSHKVVDIEQNSGSVTALRVSAPEGEYTLPTKHVVLAPGHSARDTFEMLQKRGVPMEPKPFAVGVRIEHRQRDMDLAQYKEAAGTPGLPPTSYKLSCHTEKGRGVFSFCVCPGGEVVAAASEEKRVVTNGMSEFARDGENINGGLLVSVTPEDFPSGDTLAGVQFQRELEDAAYRLGGGNYAAPAQRVEDFLKPIARQRERERSCRPIFPPSAGATCTAVSRPLCARRSRRAFRCWGRKFKGLRCARRRFDGGGDALFVACAHRARQLEFSIRPARSISLRRGRGLRRRYHECRGRRPARRRNDFGGIEP